MPSHPWVEMRRAEFQDTLYNSRCCDIYGSINCLRARRFYEWEFIEPALSSGCLITIIARRLHVIRARTRT